MMHIPDNQIHAISIDWGNPTPAILRRMAGELEREAARLENVERDGEPVTNTFVLADDDWMPPPPTPGQLRRVYEGHRNRTHHLMTLPDEVKKYRQERLARHMAHRRKSDD